MASHRLIVPSLAVIAALAVAGCGRPGIDPAPLNTSAATPSAPSAPVTPTAPVDPIATVRPVATPTPVASGTPDAGAASPTFTPLGVPASAVTRIEYRYEDPGANQRLVLTPTSITAEADGAPAATRPVTKQQWDQATAALSGLPPAEPAGCRGPLSGIRAYAGDKVVREAAATCDRENRARVDGLGGQWTQWARG